MSEIPLYPNEVIDPPYRLFRSANPVRTWGFPLYTRFHTVDDDMCQSVIIHDDYCIEELALSKKNLVIDCGAHIGTFTHMVAAQGATVIAVEPVEHNHLGFWLNNEPFRSHVTLIPKALSNTTKPITLRFGELNNPSHIVSRHVATTVTPSDGRIESIKRNIQVEAITLNEILDSLESVSILKMDIEGAEYVVLPATSPRNLAKIKLLIIETHPVMGMTNEKAQALLAQLFPTLKIYRGHQSNPPEQLQTLWLR